MWKLLLLVVAIVVPAFAGQAYVDPRTGRLLLTEADLVLPAGAIEIEISRTLVSKPVGSGLLGPAWRLNWEASLFRAGRSAVIDESSGRRYFSQDTDGPGYRSADGQTLVFRQDGSAVRTRMDGTLDSFDSQGRWVRRDFGNGNILSLQYSRGALLSRVEGPKGINLNLRTTPRGLLAEIRTSSGLLLQYTYANDRLTAVTLNGHPLARYDYDTSGRLARVDETGRGAVEFAYDSEARVASRRWADGSIERHVYDPPSNSYRLTDPTGRTTNIRWSPDGQREETTDPAGVKTVVEFDRSGRPISLTNPAGETTRFSHDLLGRVASTSDSGGRITSFQYLGDTALLQAITYADGTRQTYEYDQNRNLTAIKKGTELILACTYAPDGSLTSTQGPRSPQRKFAYHPDGRLLSETDALGATVRYEYDERGNRMRAVNPLGGVTEWTYDERGRVTSVTDAAGGKRQYTYDALGRLVRDTNQAGGVTRHEYDVRGRLVASTDPAGRTMRYQYDAADRMVSTTDAAGHTWRSEYDAAGNVTRLIDPLGGAMTSTYDAGGLPITETDATGATLRFEYSPDGRLMRTTSSTGQSARYAYTGTGRLAGITDAAGRSVRYEYDPAGRVAKMTLPDGLVRSFAYDTGGNLVLESDSLGLSVRYEYDVLRRLIRERWASGLEVSYQYDAAGNRTGWSDNAGGAVKFQFDALGQIIARTDAAGTVRRRYDASGNLIERIDPLGQIRRLTHDPAGQLVQVADPSGEVARYKYDQAGRISEILAPSGGATQLAYDPLGRLVSEKGPSGAVTRYAYGLGGRLESQTDARGQTTTYAYDAAGRLSQKRTPGGAVVDYRYNALGQLIEIDDGSFPIRYAYDAAGHRTETQYPALKRVLKYEYGVGGLLKRFVDSEGRTFQYEYDLHQRLATLRGPSGAFEFSYDLKDRLIALHYPNALKATFAYDAADRLINIAYSHSSGKMSSSWTYAYDAAGNVSDVTDAQGGVTRYDHDGAGRLAGETSPAGAVRYRYIAGGSRGERQTAGRVVRYEYDAADRLLRAGEETFRYDAGGNLVERNSASGLTRFFYDAENRLLRVVKPGGAEVTFGYGPTGERIWRKDAGGQTYFVTDGSNLLAELDASLRPKASYVHGPGLDRPLMMSKDGSDYFYIVRELGTIAGLMDAGGASPATYDTDAFGALRSGLGKLPNPFIFTSREYEPELGLYNFRSRYYDPALGRFLTEDPLRVARRDPSDLNPYVYAANKPTRHRDPLGLDIWSLLAKSPSQFEREMLGSRAGRAPGVGVAIPSPSPAPAPTPNWEPWPPPGLSPPPEWNHLYKGLARDGVPPQETHNLLMQELARMNRQTQLLTGSPPPNPSSPENLARAAGIVSLRAKAAAVAQGVGAHQRLDSAAMVQDVQSGIAKDLMDMEANLPAGSSGASSQNLPVPYRPQPPAVQEPAGPPATTGRGGDPTRSTPAEVSPAGRQPPASPPQGAGTPPAGEPGFFSTEVSASRVGTSVASAFAVASIVSLHMACLDAGGSQSYCAGQTARMIAQAAVYGVTIVAAAAAVVLAVGAVAPAAAAVLATTLAGAGIVVGVVGGGYGAYKSIDAWANATEVETQSRKAEMYKELLSQFEKTIDRQLQEDLTRILDLQAQASGICQREIQAPAGVLSQIGPESRAGTEALKGLVGRIETVASDCQRAASYRTEIESMVSQAAEYRQAVQADLELARAGSATCRTADDAAAIRQAYTTSQGYSTRIRNHLATASARNRDIAGVKANVEAWTSTLADFRGKASASVARAQALAGDAPSRVETFRTAQAQYVSLRAALVARVDKIGSLLPGDDAPAALRQQAQQAQTALGRIADSVRALPESLECDMPDMVSPRLAAEAYYSAVQEAISDLGATSCLSLESADGLVENLNTALGAADSALLEAQPILQAAVDCAARASGAAPRGGPSQPPAAEVKPPAGQTPVTPTPPAGSEPPPLVRGSTTGTPGVTTQTPPLVGASKPAPSPAPPAAEENPIARVYALVDGSSVQGQYRVLAEGREGTVTASVGYRDGTRQVISGKTAFDACLRLGYYVRAPGIRGWVRSGMAYAVQPGGQPSGQKAEAGEGGSGRAGGSPGSSPPGAAGGRGDAGRGPASGAKPSDGGRGLLGVEFETQKDIDITCYQENREVYGCQEDCYFFARLDAEKFSGCMRQRCARLQEALDRCKAAQPERK